MVEEAGIVSALAEVLVRRCLNQSAPGDATSARGPAQSLSEVEDAPELFAAGANPNSWFRHASRSPASMCRQARGSATRPLDRSLD
jgi:hypothetical protein